MNKIKKILDQVYFHITGKCPECGVNSHFIEDHLGYWNCSNCDWSEKYGPMAERFKKLKNNFEVKLQGNKHQVTS